MKLHRTISYTLISVGAAASAKAMLKRWQWEQANIFAAIMLDWDDVQAIATRAPTIPTETDEERGTIEELLHLFKEHGATHLSIPELSLKRLLDTGEVTLVRGEEPDRTYLQVKDMALGQHIVDELQARLPHLQTLWNQKTSQPILSFKGDLPSVAEIGLGFDPTHAELAHKADLSPVPRPLAYSWVQAEMIARTLQQAATLRAEIIAFQGDMIPGHEFNIHHTVEAMRQHDLTFAYFKESRHQRGDWFLAKNLTSAGLVVLAHEIEPEELLEEDWHSVSDRWGRLATEAGIRLCSVRFFRTIHADDPLEALPYLETLTQSLRNRDLLPQKHLGVVDLTIYHPERDEMALAGTGLSIAGAVGLIADWLPLPPFLKTLGLGMATMGLAGLPFWEKLKRAQGDDHHHDHHHDNGHHHHHDNGHHHDHDHDHHHHDDHFTKTAYAPKGLALAASVLYPVAAIAIEKETPLRALLHNLVVSTAGVTALTATTAETDYLLGVEEYRSYNLDWIAPLLIAASHHFFVDREPQTQVEKLKYFLTGELKADKKNIWNWLPLLGVGLTILKARSYGSNPDVLATLDREHRHAHTHHLSTFQRFLGDTKMMLSCKPLRKWSLLAPVGAVLATLFRGRGEKEQVISTMALTTTAAGQAATLTGFRNAQRTLLENIMGRTRGWTIGLLLAGLIGIISWLVRSKR